jgi:hypothetical protein
MKLPKKFNNNGLLDAGTYSASIKEVKKSLLVLGDGSSASWDKDWREALINNASVLIEQLWNVGVKEIFIDGSFVENKDHPNDIDGYFDPNLSMYDVQDMGKFQKMVSDLNNLDPHKVWDWNPASRRAYRGYPKKQLPMWHFYRVEFYPHLKQPAGIKDQHGNDMTFPSAFRQSRNNFQPKGIVKIIP